MNWPRGARSAGIGCGIKDGAEADLGLLVFDEAATWAGTFTRNAAAAAPVDWCRARLGRPARAVVVNSGNANACTGSSGRAAVDTEANAVALALRCSPEQVLVASTGPIGVRLPVERIVEGVPGALSALSPDTGPFARSILTTDTDIKVAQASVDAATVVGVGKGAAMLAPNMATMLAFLVTDAAVGTGDLQKVLDVGVDRSFNRISVDACESTNDSVFLFATGAAGQVPVDALAAATNDVCKELATKMVRDAEGGSKLVRILVEGAAGEQAASSLGRAVASSALWRAAAFGGDPNWGRVVSAMGGADRSLDLGQVSIAIGEATVFQRGEPVGDLEAARGEMEGAEVTVRCVVGDGGGSAEFLTSDLTPEYVTLNSTGTS